MSRNVFILALVVLVVIATVQSTETPSPPKKCGKNEEEALCGKLCEPSCQDPNPTICPRIACSQFTAACRCKDGTLRNEAGKCVDPKKCPPKCDED